VGRCSNPATVVTSNCKGGKLEFEDFYMAYVAACSSAGERALMPDEAIGPTERLCRECDITIKSVGPTSI